MLSNIACVKYVFLDRYSVAPQRPSCRELQTTSFHHQAKAMGKQEAATRKQKHQQTCPKLGKAVHQSLTLSANASIRRKGRGTSTHGKP